MPQKPLMYFIISLGFSWLFWIPATFINQDINSSPWVVLLYVGGLGPALAGILLSLRGADPLSRREYWSRVFDFRRIGSIWYPVILFFYPLLTLLTIFLADGQVRLNEAFQELLSQPLNLVAFLVYLYLFGPFPEELGWRGYGLDALQSRLNPVFSSLILGTVWSIWHVPLFLMRGTYQYQIGLGSAEFWAFLIAAILISFFFTWIYNNNQRSILSASLFHYIINLTGNIFFETELIRYIRIIILLVLILVLIFTTRSMGLLGLKKVGLQQP